MTINTDTLICDECESEFDADEVRVDPLYSGKVFCSQVCADEEFLTREHQRLESHQSRYI